MNEVIIDCHATAFGHPYSAATRPTTNTDPGTKWAARVEERRPPDRIELSSGQIERLYNLTKAEGERQTFGKRV
jgi:hypothetical protein